MIGHMVYTSITDNLLTDEWYSDLVQDKKDVKYKKFEKMSYVHLLASPLMIFNILLQRRNTIKTDAERHARSDNYSNTLKSKYYSKLYDKVFKNSRIEHIHDMARLDVGSRNRSYHTNSIFENEVERKLYQDEYMKNISAEEEISTYLKESYEALYSGQEKSKISNEEFNSIVNVKRKKSKSSFYDFS